MAEDQAPRNASEILKALHEFALGPEEDVTAIPLEQVQAELKAEGVDPTPLIQHVRERLAKLRAEEELSCAHAQRQDWFRRLAVCRERLSDAPSPVKQRILERLSSLSASRPALAQAYFRKFEESGEPDMQSLLEDLMMLDAMNKDDADETRR